MAGEIKVGGSQACYDHRQPRRRSRRPRCRGGRRHRARRSSCCQDAPRSKLHTGDTHTHTQSRMNMNRSGKRRQRRWKQRTKATEEGDAGRQCRRKTKGRRGQRRSSDDDGGEDPQIMVKLTTKATTLAPKFHSKKATDEPEVWTTTKTQMAMDNDARLHKTTGRRRREGNGGSDVDDGRRLTMRSNG